jgi:SAM-dependent methyltransferase
MLASLIVLILQLALAGFFLFLCLSFVTGGPFVPSSKRAVEAMIRLAKLKAGQRVIDVGSGDGRVLFAAAQAGAQAVGIEINPYLVLWTRLRAFLGPYRGRVRVLWRNLWKADLRGADVVFVYLIPWRMEDLAEKLEDELQPGALVISNSFIFPEWKILQLDTEHHIYVFQMPA